MKSRLRAIASAGAYLNDFFDISPILNLGQLRYRSRRYNAEAGHTGKYFVSNDNFVSWASTAEPPLHFNEMCLPSA